MQNRTGSAARKTLVMTASGALLATAATAGVLGGTTVSADAGTVHKSYTYKCKATAGGTDLGTQTVKVKVKAKLPAKVKRGKAIAKRPVTVSLRLPESLRQAAVDLLGAHHASGKASKAKMGVKIGKKNSSVALKGLTAKKAKIPTEAGKPWNVTAKGTIAKIAVPKRTKAKRVQLSVPKRFEVAAKLYTDDGPIASDLDCKGPKKRGFGSVRITR